VLPILKFQIIHCSNSQNNYYLNYHPIQDTSSKTPRAQVEPFIKSILIHFAQYFISLFML